MRTQAFLFCLFLCVLSGLALAGDWQLERRDDARDISVYTRKIPGTSYNTFYAVTRVNARLAGIVAVLSDVPAMPEWLARMKSAKLIKREGDSDIWLHSVYKLPYPFIDREGVMRATLKQDQSGVVEIVTRAEKGFVSTNPKRIRLTNMQSTWRLTPEKNGVVKIEMWGQGDPGGYMPPMLFNYNLPDESVQTLKLLRQMLTREKYRQKQLRYIREP
ncbi:MAG: START domain-containing protein [bacterium]|nr:START domain-containing protein [bacterium]